MVSGISKYLDEHSPGVELILADPMGSILADYVNKGELGEKSAGWLVEGIGEDYIPTASVENCSRTRARPAAVNASRRCES